MDVLLDDLPAYMHISVLAVASFSVWLVVRTINRREVWAKRMLAAVIGLPVLYVASFGPACWWFASDRPPLSRFGFGGFYIRGAIYAPRIFWPIGRVSICGPEPIRNAIGWYATRGGKSVMIPFCYDGDGWVGAAE